MRGVREIEEAAKMLMEKGQRMNECRIGEQVQGKMIAWEPVNNQRLFQNGDCGETAATHSGLRLVRQLSP